MNNTLGQKRYRVEKPLGSGGMGDVYLAHDLESDIQVAIKKLKPELAIDSEACFRFKAEFDAMNEIRHQNVVRAFQYHQQDTEVFFSLEYVPGKALSEYIYGKEGELTYDRKIEVLYQISSGLAAAHRAGFIHHDVKPQNVLVSDEGVVKLIDFGLVERTDADKAMTQTQNNPIGTLYYMPPEQFRGQTTDERSDIYSLGILAYELLTGKRPFNVDIPLTLFIQHAVGNMASIRDFNRYYPKWLELFVRACTHKKPERRFQKVEHIVEMFDVMKARALDRSFRGRLARYLGDCIGL